LCKNDVEEEREITNKERTKHKRTWKAADVTLKYDTAKSKSG
jgi:hypothetical protein